MAKMTQSARRDAAQKLLQADLSLGEAITALRALEAHYRDVGDTFTAQTTSLRWRVLQEAKPSLHAAAAYEQGVLEAEDADEASEVLVPQFIVPEMAAKVPMPVDRNWCAACGRKPGSTPGCVCDDR